MPQLTLFEHQQIALEELGLDGADSYLNLLEGLNEAAGDTLIAIGRKTLKATQYVGVLQVKDLTIQILPKIASD